MPLTGKPGPKHVPERHGVADAMFHIPSTGCQRWFPSTSSDIAQVRVGIVNRFGSGRYLLGDLFADRGLDIEYLELSTLAVAPDGSVRAGGADVSADAVLWRLSENVWGGCETMATALERTAPLVNSVEVLGVCADKWRCFERLVAAGFPVVDTWWVAPGSAVPDLGEHTVFKPAKGAGGRGVTFRGGAEDRVPADGVEAWVAQPYVGESSTHVRVLVVASTVVTSYRRLPAPGVKVNNVERGGTRVEVSDGEAGDLALRVADLLGSVIVGVDLVPNPWWVLEVNANPGIPPDALDVCADLLVGAFRSIGRYR